MWVRPEKTAFFVGNVGVKLDQNEPVKFTFLEADLQSVTSEERRNLWDAAVEEVDVDKVDILDESGDDSERE